MTALEQSVALALRLSDSAATKLLTEIQRHIDEARAELNRLGLASTVASGTNRLVESAIISYAVGKMSDEKLQAQYMEAFYFQADNLRKSGDFIS